MKKVISVFFILGVLAFIVYWFDLYVFFTTEYLEVNFAHFKDLYTQSPFYTSLVAFFVYFALVLFSIPIMSLFTIFYGALFGPLIATIIICLAATLGFFLLALAIRHLFSDFILKHYRSKYDKIKEQIDEFNSVDETIFFLRSLPVFPFWLLNILIPLFPVSIFRYTFVSFLGIIPGTLLFAYLGSTLKGVLTEDVVLNWELLLALILIGVLPLTMRFIRSKFMKKKNSPKQK